MTTLIWNKVDFRAKQITRAREGYYIEKRVILPRRPSNPECVCTKQQSSKIYEAKLMELERQINKCMVFPGHVNIPCSIIDRIPGEQIGKDVGFNSSINQ